ncbi:MAG: histidine ammonia-lyase [Bernardetiaceae bacterium]|nr:histidine ammonia-lyase [Bernardetiaceae bacterium]
MHEIHTYDLKPEEFLALAQSDKKIKLSEEVRQKVIHCRNYLDTRLQQSDEPIYGINTGFGFLCNTQISKADIQTLQRNLVESHACGTGARVPNPIVKLMLLLKIQSLAYGHSGICLATLERLCDFYNHNMLPVIFEQGSLGASGDLAPLAHLALPLLGLGKIWYEGKDYESAAILAQKGWQPLDFQAKEGLALINGTQFMNAYALHILLEGRKLLDWADKIGALSLDVFDGRIEPFWKHSHQIRKQKGQAQTAARILEYLEGSELMQQDKIHVQDPYSFRCMPQVHGASRDALNYCYEIIERELNSVTDNPNIFPDENLILSAGNFHGQALALSLDFMAIAMAEIASISERRLYLLINGERNLPTMLIQNSGLNSGLMIAQYTAASIVSQNKQLCTPASVDTIISSRGQEDHVSMGANAATKAYRVLENIRNVLAIELIAATQALDFCRPHRTSAVLEQLHTAFRSQVSMIEKDRILSEDIHKAAKFLQVHVP